MNVEDLLSDFVSEGFCVYEFGIDELFSGVEDICECLVCNLGCVFMSLLFGELDYFCIVELFWFKMMDVF